MTCGLHKKVAAITFGLDKSRCYPRLLATTEKLNPIFRLVSRETFFYSSFGNKTIWDILSHRPANVIRQTSRLRENPFRSEPFQSAPCHAAGISYLQLRPFPIVNVTSLKCNLSNASCAVAAGKSEERCLPGISSDRFETGRGRVKRGASIEKQFHCLNGFESCGLAKSLEFRATHARAH